MITFRMIEQAQAYAKRMSRIHGMHYAVVRSGIHWAVMLSASTMGRPIVFSTSRKAA